MQSFTKDERVKVARKRRGLTLGDAAALMGVGLNTLLRSERGIPVADETWERIYKVLPEARDDSSNDNSKTNDDDTAPTRTRCARARLGSPVGRARYTKGAGRGRGEGEGEDEAAGDPVRG